MLPAGTEPSTVSVLDPDTLLALAPPLRLPEPSIARLSSDGDSVIALGADTVFRLRLDRQAGRLLVDERWRPRYGPSPGRSYGWDPVIAEHHLLWMDNGRNDTDRAMVGHRLGTRPRPPVVGPPRRRASIRQRRDLRAALRNRVQPAGLGLRRRRRGRLRRRQRGASCLATGGRRARAAVAARELRPRRAPDRLPRHPRADRRRLARPCHARQPAGAPRAVSSPAARCSAAWQPRAGPPPHSVTTSSWCSTSTPARRRPGSLSRRPCRGSCSRARLRA